ncbi:hypothetical protein SLEP1_g59097 [Rubroshorea leprosula]|uniref:Phosphoribulokinase/uridine kinase domain-containing protein n=1 Tax=Rubroshorea leprosula TaxID=152421 RepID=A0AAV5MSF4_9ROSI|nr:hypothetical protein SLEP1_g59097 [Rubroshorea leprosula]
MPEETTPIDYVMEKASGPHFSGLRSPTANSAPAAFADANAPRQPFVIDAFDTEQLVDCIQKLKSGQSYEVPIYDFKNHHRCSDSFRQVNASDVIILEGILVFHDQRVRNLMNMKFLLIQVRPRSLVSYGHSHPLALW